MMLVACSTSYIPKTRPLTSSLTSIEIKPVPQIDTSKELSKEDWLKGYVNLYYDDKEKTDLLITYQKILNLFL